MISREEAREKLFGNDAIHDSPFDIVMEIYDSIGSCEECKWYTKDGEVGAEIPYCGLHGINKLPSNFFCSDFKRKVNE
jgi:hypothetical protein